MSLTARLTHRLLVAPRPGVLVFAMLFFVEAMARASLATVIPLQSYELLKEPRYVSYLGFGLGGLGLLAGMLVPLLIRGISRRWTYTLGALLLIAAAGFLAQQTVAGQITGMAVRNLGALCLNISLVLYIMDYVRRHEFVRNDSTRMTFSMVAWTVSPYLGVWLYEHVGPDATYAWSAGWACLLIGLFWYLRMSEGGVIVPARKPPENPFHFVPRFISQPRLMLAWSIAFGRSAFWSTLFVYGPILMKKTGQGADAAGLLISASQVLLGTALLWGRFAGWAGLRTSIPLSFLGMFVCMILAGAMGEQAPLLAAGVLVLASFFCTGLDAVGGVPYYRAVRARERAPMTAVYRTYLEFGDLVPNLVYGILLLWLPLSSVFVADGIACLAFAWVCWRYLPKGM